MVGGRVAHPVLKGPSVVKELIIGSVLGLAAGGLWKMHHWNEQRKTRAFYDLLEKGEISVELQSYMYDTINLSTVVLILVYTKQRFEKISECPTRETGLTDGLTTDPERLILNRLGESDRDRFSGYQPLQRKNQANPTRTLLYLVHYALSCIRSLYNEHDLAGTSMD
ncbi:hypothetical protein M8C21_031172 [Ambrosia artemisiifolia]|uniref:Cytochrome c oxidase subunit 5C n=1 Tax=Ambrosia artemisiifolia TaxID=4212 RepID=A0AAD5CGV6_AMBAR|nr:hypothetical protein M8C21_031172 [Ambrosia artemisiifolia]